MPTDEELSQPAFLRSNDGFVRNANIAAVE